MKKFVALSAFTLAVGVACVRLGPQKNAQTANVSVPSFAAFQAIDSSLGLDPAGNCSKKNLAGFDETNCQDLRQEFRYVVYVGQQIYCYWDQKKARPNAPDFEAVAKTLEARITDQTTFGDYYANVLKVWAAQFGDGHVNAMPDDQIARLDVLSVKGVDLSVLGAATDHEVVAVEKSSNALLPKGAVLTAINETPIADAVSHLASLSSGSTERMRRYFAGRRLFDVVETSANAQLSVTFVDPTTHSSKTVSLSRELDLKLAPKEGAAKPDEDDGAKNVQAMLLPNNIGYLKITSFSGSRIEDFIDTAMRGLKNTRALIIDVRSNGGGDQSGDRILRQLSTKKITRYRFSPRRSDYLIAERPLIFTYAVDPTDDRFFDWQDDTVDPSTDSSYAGKPVAVLTSPNCFSACDTFVAAIKANKLGLVIGESTGGGTGTPLVFSLPATAMKFRYGVVRGKTATNEWIEGAGTAPDVLVERAITDLGVEDSQTSQVRAAIASLDQLSGVTTPPQPVATAETAPAPEVSWISATKREVFDLQRIEKADY